MGMLMSVSGQKNNKTPSSLYFCYHVHQTPIYVEFWVACAHFLTAICTSNKGVVSFNLPNFVLLVICWSAFRGTFHTWALYEYVPVTVPLLPLVLKVPFWFILCCWDHTELRLLTQPMKCRGNSSRWWFYTSTLINTSTLPLLSGFSLTICTLSPPPKKEIRVQETKQAGRQVKGRAISHCLGWSLRWDKILSPSKRYSSLKGTKYVCTVYLYEMWREAVLKEEPF